MAFHITDIPAGTPVPAESAGRNAHIATVDPLVSRIGHGRGRTLITQLCAATTAEGPRSKADQIGGTAPPPVTSNANHVA
jgi:hypothetical protein